MPMKLEDETQSIFTPSCFECEHYAGDEAPGCNRPGAKPWGVAAIERAKWGFSAYRPAECPLRPGEPVAGD